MTLPDVIRAAPETVMTEHVNMVLVALGNVRYFSLRLYHHHKAYQDTITVTRSSDDRLSKRDVQSVIMESSY